MTVEIPFREAPTIQALLYVSHEYEIRRKVLRTCQGRKVGCTDQVPVLVRMHWKLQCLRKLWRASMEAESAPATRCAGWATGASAPASHSPATGGERGAGRLLEPFWANQRAPGRRLKKQAATSQPSRWLLPIFAAPLDVSERSFQLHVPHLPALKFVPATEDVVVARRVLRYCVPCAEDALAPEALPVWC